MTNRAEFGIVGLIVNSMRTAMDEPNRFVTPERTAEAELESLALEGVNSGESIDVGPEYWEAKHSGLTKRLNDLGKG